MKHENKKNLEIIAEILWCFVANTRFCSLNFPRLRIRQQGYEYWSIKNPPSVFRNYLSLLFFLQNLTIFILSFLLFKTDKSVGQYSTNNKNCISTMHTFLFVKVFYVVLVILILDQFEVWFIECMIEEISFMMAVILLEAITL